ncbi:MAG TPA: hypothetical protein VKX16_04855 [Chloroflexota bacterium]|nr:hypothetical protein [Chloroflexota bacterium]
MEEENAPAGTYDEPVPAPEEQRTGARPPGFTHVPHPHIALRKRQGPVKVADQLNRRGWMARFNSRVALIITIGVGSMWCAYIFALIAFVSLPSALATHDKIIIVGWIAQTFLQLVLLPIIIVGQNIQAEASDKRAAQTYNDAEAVLHEALQIQEHLAAQDAHLQSQDARLEDIIAALTRSHLLDGGAAAASAE